jgi:aromatic-L-amino-acid/L-tryptophan decarboxylase
VWQAAPAATELEALVLDWLLQLLPLPPSFMNRGGTSDGGGVILGMTSEAVLVTPMKFCRHRVRTGSGVRIFSFFLQLSEVRGA